MEMIRTIVMGAPLHWCILASGLLALGAQLGLIHRAVKRRVCQRDLRLAAEAGNWEAVGRARVPRPYLEVLALLALLTVPAATIASVDRARGLLRASFSAADPAALARLLEGW